jgi:hypothetical protein
MVAMPSDLFSMYTVVGLLASPPLEIGDGDLVNRSWTVDGSLLATIEKNFLIKLDIKFSQDTSRVDTRPVPREPPRIMVGNIRTTMGSAGRCCFGYASKSVVWKMNNRGLDYNVTGAAHRLFLPIR